MLACVFALLTALGLSASSGLNAYIPLLMLGVLSRFTHLAMLPSGWNWLSNGWVMGGLAVLLAVEVVVDKIPIVDHVNDLVQTVVRPTSGGLAAGAATSGLTTTAFGSVGSALNHTTTSSMFAGHEWIPVAGGIVLAAIVHGLKAVSRGAVNLTTAGVGAPVASTAEDAFSVVMSLLAIIAPFLIIICLVLLLGAFIGLARRRRARRAQKRLDKMEKMRRRYPPPPPGVNHDDRTLDFRGP
jgi:hypothetical protein